MVKKKNIKGSKSDIFNFRTGSHEKKEELKKRTDKLKKTKDITQREIYEAGLLVHEGQHQESSFLNKKTREIATRNDMLDELIKSNAAIQAYNLRLKSLNPQRYKHLNKDDGIIKLFNENGNRII